MNLSVYIDTDRLGLLMFIKKGNCEYSDVDIHNKIHKTTCKTLLTPVLFGLFSSSKGKTKFLKMCISLFGSSFSDRYISNWTFLSFNRVLQMNENIAC